MGVIGRAVSASSEWALLYWIQIESGGDGESNLLFKWRLFRWRKRERVVVASVRLTASENGVRVIVTGKCTFFFLSVKCKCVCVLLTYSHSHFIKSGRDC